MWMGSNIYYLILQPFHHHHPRNCHRLPACRIAVRELDVPYLRTILSTLFKLSLFAFQKLG
jgi:hypothetical protein